VTFVSLTTGWVLGTVPCGAASCAQLWKTDDGGRKWTSVPAPPVPVSQDSAAGVREIRFANPDDGWAFLPDLWATHDGGAHWTRQPIGQVFALEAASGAVHAVVLQGGETAFSVMTSPVHGEAWRPSATKVEVGAGPVPRAQVVLHGAAGWLLIVNRTLVGGARLDAGAWVNWQPPCADAGGAVELAASSRSDLVAFCDEGEWNDRPRAERAYVSTDAGASFRLVPTALTIRGVYPVTAASTGVWVVAGADSNAKAVLLRTADGGRTWRTVHRENHEGGWLELGFTSPRQGVAISQGKTGKLLMTFDGGQTWAAVAAG
jgi:photosystem II stability/assembly factor-like uncharacterized protein